ncbi:MAG: dimethylamine monooxygenase subunit DmmA family protein [Solirubrobacteraceae bacterium]
MPYGVSMEHTTLPKDTGLTLDPSARVHLIAASPADDAVTALLAQWRETRGGTAALLHVGPAPEGAPADTTMAADGEDLAARLTARLREARVGIRVYVAGDEGFVRATSAAALAAGLLPDEMRTEVTASAARRVWCSHCRAITEGVTTTVTPCAGCGRTLEVFHHFSRRRGAYLGFQADAEAPGELPEPEVAWP